MRESSPRIRTTRGTRQGTRCRCCSWPCSVCSCVLWFVQILGGQPRRAELGGQAGERRAWRQGEPGGAMAAFSVLQLLELQSFLGFSGNDAERKRRFVGIGGTGFFLDPGLG